MSDKEKEQGEGTSLDEVTSLLSDIFKKVADRGTVTAKEKFHQALTEFHGTLKNIDDELEGSEEKEKE
jgi:hypothetical protein